MRFHITDIKCPGCKRVFNYTARFTFDVVRSTKSSEFDHAYGPCMKSNDDDTMYCPHCNFEFSLQRRLLVRIIPMFYEHGKWIRGSHPHVVPHE
jgi:hypothetical protein